MKKGKYSRYQQKTGLNVGKPGIDKKQPKSTQELLDVLAMLEVQKHDVWVNKIQKKYPNITNELFSSSIYVNNLPKVPSGLRKTIRQIKGELRKRGIEISNKSREEVLKLLKKRLIK